MKQARAITLFLVFGACALLAYWRSQSPQSTGGQEPSQINPAQCDQNLWQHVYNPRRPRVLAPCISVTRTAEEIPKEAGGAVHLFFLLAHPLAALPHQKKSS